MAFCLDDVVPWGRSFEEYHRMFALSEKDLSRRILGCADGPASFNSKWTKQGGEIVSIDPLYQFSLEEIRDKIDQVFPIVLEETRKNAQEFIWETIDSVDQLGRIRQEAMNEFLKDYSKGFQEGRYIDLSLPSLPFKDQEFDLALCSHYLFLYSPHLSLEFHLKSIRELCRVSREVRIFPLLELGGLPSRHLSIVEKGLSEEGYHVAISTVSYEFQRGGNKMMIVERESMGGGRPSVLTT